MLANTFAGLLSASKNLYIQVLDTAGGLKGWMERVENLRGVGSYFCLTFSRNSRQCSIRPLNIEVCITGALLLLLRS